MSGAPGWDEDGNYVPWLFQNAVLLPGYLNHRSVPELNGRPLDSWAAFMSAWADDAAVLELLADRVNEVYLE